MNISNNIKRLAVTALLLLMGTAAMAQETTSKQINQIKRDPLYLYAEATMDNEADAQSVAYELLLKQVEEYIASKSNLTQADNVLIKDVKSKGESLSMMRGEMHRVFVYVKKSDIEGVTNTTLINNSTGATVTISSVMPSKSPAEVETDMNGMSDDGEYHVFEDEFQPEDEATQRRLANEGGANQDLPAAPAEATAVPGLSGWQQQAMGALLQCADVAAVRARLNRLKAEYRVKRYGTADKCPSVADAYWAIFDRDGKLVTILGTGASQRVDYRTGQYTTLEQYKGMNALWFNFAK